MENNMIYSDIIVIETCTSTGESCILTFASALVATQCVFTMFQVSAIEQCLTFIDIYQQSI